MKNKLGAPKHTFIFFYHLVVSSEYYWNYNMIAKNTITKKNKKCQKYQQEE
jgi:hypothetical protein